MTEELKNLKRKRGILKSQLTNFQTFLDGITHVPPTDQNAITDIQQDISLSGTVASELTERINRISPLLEQFHEIQSIIECLVEENQLPSQNDEREEFENRFFSLIGKAKHLATRPSETPPTPNPQVRPSNKLTLPTIKLKTFSGNLDEWLEFREMFEAMIHNKDDLDEIEKYHYLKLSLSGDASEVIRSIEFSPSNYSIAWQLLRERFDNERLLVDNHVSAIFNIPTIIRESATKLRKLIDDLNKNLRALKSLKQPVDSWDTLIIHIISQKLDPKTTREWEEFKASNRDLSLETLKSFLKGRADFLEALESKSVEKQHPRDKPNTTKSFVTTSYSCPICKGSHNVYNCNEFLKLSPKERNDSAKRHKLCMNCLRQGHFQSNCKSGSCTKCKRKHNTLLHFPEPPPAETPAANVPTHNVASTISNHAVSGNTYVLLSTVLLQVKDKRGVLHEVRGLLDNGSQSNFISQELCSLLDLPTTDINAAVTGITQISTPIKHSVEIEIQARHSNYKTDLLCLVVPKITENIPFVSLNPNKLNLPQNLVLADPAFGTPGEIQILLGAGIFWDLISIGQIKLGKQMPTLQKTRLGWIISGPLPISSTQNPQINCNFIKSNDLHDQIQNFWKIEECVESKTPIYTAAEQACQDHFTKNTVKLPNGHFQVKIPFKGDPSLLGDSKEIATKRFYAIERKLERDAELKRQYHDFMSEYEHLKHMTKVDFLDPNQIRYYIPHHAVIKDSLTTKLRVVFDASAKTTSGHSLNDLQMVGPTIQEDLLHIILGFRKHQIAMTADIKQMYRQVFISEDQRPLQSIIWRVKPTEPLQIFELNTVTYGTASAAFLAIRALHQVGLDCKQSHPKVSEAILSNFYVDDFLSGTDTLEEASSMKNDISVILRNSGFVLRKWISNVPQLLGENASSQPLDSLPLGKDQKTKTLGLQWDPNSDTFQFSISKPENKNHTKRNVLSCIAQIFDPMGLVSPAITLAKIFMQKLWQAQLDWDESLPSNLHNQWCQFYNQLPELNAVSVNRKVICENPRKVEMHGFCDSSESAYGAVIYIRCIDQQDNVHVHLLCAKSKVAPLKTQTIPRLELCGAVILVRLVHKARAALNITVGQITYWCDSNIVLGWIHTEPNLLKTFVAHRIAEIQSLSDPSNWKHVNSGDNPADLVSRGVKPSALQSSKLWWNGPHWLSNLSLPNSDLLTPCELPEIRSSTVTLTVHEKSQLFPFERFSNLRRIQATMAYILRWFQGKGQIHVGPLDAKELWNSLIKLVQLSQKETFATEYKALSEGKTNGPKSRLVKLNPFMHDDGTIRVGGRLQNSNFEYNKKHPFVLDSNHILTKLIFIEKHKKLLHPGPQLLLASVREHFWPISGRNLARQTVHKCVTCFKTKPKSTEPLMGNLPKHRVVPNLPFQISGVDYMGPFQMKDRQGRGCRVTKCYVALFICFTTKAVHLELVTSLSTEAFIMTLKRFIARRGLPSYLYSDNGSNFVGANSQLEELGKFLNAKANELATASANESIIWKFIPAYSPNFGGLWEAGVKSAKSHLKRVLGPQPLTFEAFYTLLVQIEAILNSRPLSPLSCDPNDFNPLTPSHFLLGRTATSIPDYDLTSVPENRLGNYQRVEAMKQHFWQRWSKEYVTELQQRVKATTHQAALKVGDLVVIKDAARPPQNWTLGRITELVPGADQVCRVACVKTAKGVIKRAVSKICPLPSNEQVTKTETNPSVC